MYCCLRIGLKQPCFYPYIRTDSLRSACRRPSPTHRLRRLFMANHRPDGWERFAVPRAIKARVYRQTGTPRDCQSCDQRHSSKTSPYGPIWTSITSFINECNRQLDAMSKSQGDRQTARRASRPTVRPCRCWLGCPELYHVNSSPTATSR